MPTRCSLGVLVVVVVVVVANDGEQERLPGEPVAGGTRMKTRTTAGRVSPSLPRVNLFSRRGGREKERNTTGKANRGKRSFFFLFPPFRPICSPSLFLRFSFSRANLAPVSPPFTRALFRLLPRSIPTACVSAAKSIDRNVFRSGRNERECNRKE
ncbi:hypothetical protein PUN28_012770 [Cardiocondyla obscurior]|uniref:Secreted protein n=1 Tax=Cardiocondyla obscurior TaxID=286306 RepID=A0AAW2F4V1_9HYME